MGAQSGCGEVEQDRIVNGFGPGLEGITKADINPQIDPYAAE
jgi:hypothetical protein